jgi:anti-sigma factor RsiW
MSSSDRSRELIHKYLEDLASRSEVVELEALLSTDPEVAGAFAEAARLDGMLKGHFRKQRKIDQVAALLHADGASPATVNSSPEATTAGASQPGTLPEPPRLTGSTFVRRLSEPTRPRRSPIARTLALAARRWRWIAASLLLGAIVAGVSVLRRPGDESFRLVSGRVTVAGREAERVPVDLPFEVAGRDGAVLQGPRGIRLELTPATRAVLRQISDGVVIQLSSGGAEFTVPRGPPGLRIETELGIVTGADCRFSLELGTILPAPASATQGIQGPRLIVVVARGSVIVERNGVSTTLSAGERQAFL